MVEEALEKELAERRATKEKQDEEDAAKKISDALAAEEARKAAVEIAAAVMAEETQDADAISSVTNDTDGVPTVSATVTVTTSTDLTTASSTNQEPETPMAIGNDAEQVSNF